MKENVILVNYSVESEAYQALSELKRAAANAQLQDLPGGGREGR